MNINTIRWSYAIAHAGLDKRLDMEFSDGPIPEARVREILGGAYDIQPLRDSTAIAYRHDQDESLEPNEHYPGLRGTVLVGKMSGSVFVGAIGIGR